MYGLQTPLLLPDAVHGLTVFDVCVAASADDAGTGGESMVGDIAEISTRQVMLQLDCITTTGYAGVVHCSCV